MARRTELKGIACGMLGRFNSRNNDVDGYWGIGKLCRAANEYGTSSVVIDLLTAQTIPASWIAMPTIELDFKPEFNSQHHFFRSAVGRPYLSTLRITDDLGKSYAVTAGGNCLPHDPRNERRAIRASDY